ncbi:MAG: hypothetical protein QW680_08375 [Pyrobaculum sp.]
MLTTVDTPKIFIITYAFLNERMKIKSWLLVVAAVIVGFAIYQFIIYPAIARVAR